MRIIAVLYESILLTTVAASAAFVCFSSGKGDGACVLLYSFACSVGLYFDILRLGWWWPFSVTVVYAPTAIRFYLALIVSATTAACGHRPRLTPSDVAISSNLPKFTLTESQYRFVAE